MTLAQCCPACGGTGRDNEPRRLIVEGGTSFRTLRAPDCLRCSGKGFVMVPVAETLLR